VHYFRKFTRYTTYSVINICLGYISVFDVHMTVHRGKFLITKPTRCTNFSNALLKWHSTCFGQFLCPSSGVFHCTHSSGICHTGLLTACEQDQDETAVTSWSCLQAVSRPVWHIPLLCVRWKTSNDGQRNCPKHVEFYFKNKFEKLMHLVCFIIRKRHFSCVFSQLREIMLIFKHHNILLLINF